MFLSSSRGSPLCSDSTQSWMLTVGVHENSSTIRRYFLWSCVDLCENQQLRLSTCLRSRQIALIMWCSSVLYLCLTAGSVWQERWGLKTWGGYGLCTPLLLMRFTLRCFWLVYYHPLPLPPSLPPPTSSQFTNKLQQYQFSVKDDFVVHF